jgi:hypothetical protein
LSSLCIVVPVVQNILWAVWRSLSFLVFWLLHAPRCLFLAGALLLAGSRGRRRSVSRGGFGLCALHPAHPALRAMIMKKKGLMPDGHVFWASAGNRTCEFQ